MLVDTHCHLDASEFGKDTALIIENAFKNGVGQIVVPAVCRQNFDAVIALNQRYQPCAFALGIHPMYVDAAQANDLEHLQNYLKNHVPVAIGEIGLDYFFTKNNVEIQQFFFTEQLKIASTHQLPVILHVRQAVDDVLKFCRKYHTDGGIAHAFNGSFQQATQFIDLGFKLGFGGAMTYTRALKIRQLAKTLPLDAIVLETDAPDIPPAWLQKNGRNSPEELPKIAEILASLRGLKIAQVIEITTQNAHNALPKLPQLYTRLQVLL